MTSEILAGQLAVALLGEEDGLVAAEEVAWPRRVAGGALVPYEGRGEWVPAEGTGELAQQGPTSDVTEHIQVGVVLTDAVAFDEDHGGEL